MPSFEAEYMKKTPRSKAAFERTSARIPGGVGSAIQFFKPYPFYVKKSKGARLWDLDGNQYVDFCLSYCAMIAGHANPKIVNAIKRQAVRGTLHGMPGENALELTEEISKRYPVAEMLRFTNSGMEATSYAIRLARAATKRNKIIKCEGEYHGAHDYLLISDKPVSLDLLGPRDTPTPVPESLGIPADSWKNTLTVPFNDLEVTERVLSRNRNEVAAIITEPLLTNSGIIPPLPGYLQGLRKLADDYGALLIIDEVKTGCNVAYGGGCELYKLEPDLVTLAKAIGGGTPLGAFGGKRKYMQMISPLGGAVHYGTYNANPLCVAAGIASLKKVLTPKTYGRLRMLGERLKKGILDAIQDTRTRAVASSVNSLGCIFFGLEEIPNDFRAADTNDKQAWHRFWLGMLSRGIVPGGAAWFEEWAISASHTSRDIDLMIEAAEDTLRSAK